MEPLKGNTARASDLDPVSTKRERIAALAKQSPSMAFTSLNHHLDLDWLLQACALTRKDGAAGIDGEKYETYREKLLSNLETLLERAKSGSYRAPPVRRVHIPKGSGSATRPIGIPTFEDKVLQRAVVMILEAIYEQDFYDGSYGFRPGRSAQHALDALRTTLMGRQGGWVLEVDIQRFFDTLDRAHLREFLQRRVRDGVLLRLIGKWLNAGVMEDGTLHYPESGSPQGGVISPLLANVYLHYVLDEWFLQEVQPRLRGEAKLIRYADDFIIVFTDESDAHRVLEVLGKRFAKYGLALHPEKTRLIDFRSPRRRKPSVKLETFDLLGFTIHWGRTRRGGWAVYTCTAASRFRRAVKAIQVWCRGHRHDPLLEQHKTLVLKIRGHYGYYGRCGNYQALSRFVRLVTKIWRKWLQRRSWKTRLNWKKFNGLLDRHPLPPPRITVPACPRANS